MTKAEFQRKYPQGLNNIIYQFYKALHTIMTTSEIDHVIAYAPRKEKKWLKDFKKAYSHVRDWGDLSIWVLLPMIASPALLSNVISVMVSENKEIYHGENEAK